MGAVLKALALVIPLGLDTFAVAAALGMAGLPAERHMRMSLLFGAFEAVMPLVGLGLGAALGSAVGGVANYVAIVVLLAVGVHALAGAGEADEELARVGLLARASGWSVVALGLSISLDELAIGFTLGLLGLPVALFVVIVGVQAFVAAQVGLRIGARLGERVREGAERLAGIALVGLAVVLAVERVA